MEKKPAIVAHRLTELREGIHVSYHFCHVSSSFATPMCLKNFRVESNRNICLVMGAED